MSTLTLATHAEPQRRHNSARVPTLVTLLTILPRKRLGVGAIIA